MSDAPDPELLAAAAKAFTTPFEAVLKLVPEGGAPVWVDGRKSPPTVSADAPGETDHNAKDGTLDCAVHGRLESLRRAIASERAFESSFVSGRITVAGDIAVLARLTLSGAK